MKLEINMVAHVIGFMISIVISIVTVIGVGTVMVTVFVIVKIIGIVSCNIVLIFLWLYYNYALLLSCLTRTCH